MDRQLIWAIKAQSISNTRKNLLELSKKQDLFDVSVIDTGSDEYKQTVISFDKARNSGVSIVTYIDKEYPARLKNIPSPPALLYVKGNVSILKDTVFVGMVGARDSDDYGLRITEALACEIGETGIGIISGGAKGTDAASHRGALRASAPTVAVLGSGLDRLYPKENIALFEKIVEKGGAIITEYPFGTEPLHYNFPRRNRIIAGLSSALIVTRAAHRSGSLITASQALEQGISVYAVPGNIDNKLSGGTNALIKDGAIPLLSAMDVIDELIERDPDFFVRKMDEREREAEEIQMTRKPAPKQNLNLDGLSSYEKEIVDIIVSGASTPNLIEEKISFGAERLTALLGMMEIKGIIKKTPDKRYILTKGG